MSLLLIAIYNKSVFVCLSHWPANRAREMQHSVLLFISRGEDIKENLRMNWLQNDKKEIKIDKSERVCDKQFVSGKPAPY